jgi:dTDP-4-dehydrorhamnose 3,5-epimerase-like enzyme
MLINIPVIEDYRGNIGVVQNGEFPFDFKRIYYLFDVPSSASRGGHAHVNQDACLIALSGSFEVILDDGIEKITYFLNKPNIGLHIPKGIWRELDNFSSGAVCLVVASDIFDENDYIRNYDDFLRSKS